MSGGVNMADIIKMPMIISLLLFHNVDRLINFNASKIHKMMGV